MVDGGGHTDRRPSPGGRKPRYRACRFAILLPCQRSPNTPAFVTKSHHGETEARTHRSEKFSRRCGRRGQPRTAEAEPGAEGTRSTRTIPTAAGMIRGARAGRCPSRRSSARLSASPGRISNRRGWSFGLAPISASRSVPTSSGSAGFARPLSASFSGRPWTSRTMLR